MRSLRLALAAAAMIASTAFASPTEPKNGAEYTTLAAPQPTQAVGKKIEVIEFFAYHCPACYAMEPAVGEWVKKHKDDVTFKRIAFPFRGPTDAEAHLWVTLDAMGKEDELHSKIFNANHVEHAHLNADDIILDWINKKSGLNNAQFLGYWNSFGVLTKLKRLPQLVANYKIDSTPSFVVDGKYLTNPGMVGTANPALEHQLPEAVKATLDALVAKAMKEKGYEAAAKAPEKPAGKAAEKAKPARPAAKTATK